MTVPGPTERESGGEGRGGRGTRARTAGTRIGTGVRHPTPPSRQRLRRGYGLAGERRGVCMRPHPAPEVGTICTHHRWGAPRSRTHSTPQNPVVTRLPTSTYLGYQPSDPSKPHPPTDPVTRFVTRPTLDVTTSVTNHLCELQLPLRVSSCPLRLPLRVRYPMLRVALRVKKAKNV